MWGKSLQSASKSAFPSILLHVYLRSNFIYRVNLEREKEPKASMLFDAPQMVCGCTWWDVKVPNSLASGERLKVLETSYPACSLYIGYKHNTIIHGY